MPRTKQRIAHANGWHQQQKQFDCPICWPFAKMSEEREEAEKLLLRDAFHALERMMDAYDIGQRAGSTSAIGLGRDVLRRAGGKL